LRAKQYAGLAVLYPAGNARHQTLCNHGHTMIDDNVPLMQYAIKSTYDNVLNLPSLSTEYHDAAIPAHAQQALHSMYGNVYSSMPHFRVYGGLDGANTFILRKNQAPIAVFLFRVADNKAQVLNEGMPVDEMAVTQFADFVFHRHETVDLIIFRGVAHSIKSLAYPFSQCSCTDDSVISLPESTDAYLQELGKATRKNIKQYLNRLKRDFPTFDFQVHDGHSVDEQLIRKIISLNRVRFGKKGKVSDVTTEEEERIIQMIRACGIVGVISVEGKPCAGSLVYCIGEHYHSWLKAHDPAYDDYRLGLIGSFLMISECIRRGGKTFHLMWGREPHKALLNSELRTFSNLTVYRNHAAALRNCSVLFSQVYQHSVRQGKLWLLEMERGTGKMSYPIKAGLNGMRKIKTWLPDRR
jgi:hypothetical protein